MVVPIRGKIAIQPIDPEEMTSGGVIMPDCVSKKRSLCNRS